VLPNARLADTRPPDAPSGDAPFTACRRLFGDFPLAVRRHYAEHRYGSMVLVSRAAGTASFSVLIMERDDLFVIRPWDRRDWARVEIWPDGPVPGEAGRLIASSVPVPRDGALLGWTDGRQVRAIVCAYGRLPEPWDDPSALPGIMVLPPAGSDPGRWPPLSGDPRTLEEGRLWEHLARGQVADLSMLVARQAGIAYWVPAALGPARGAAGSGCIVVTERLGTADCWLPAGVYAGHQALAEGVQVPPARELLALPGVTDLAWGAPAAPDRDH
jgi:hypothetical protein